MKDRNQKAFTLIELLIVVAIIAILAAIAVPNFLEAQTRSKVSRARNDMRTLATAIEAYTVDHNVPPSDAGNGVGVGTGAIYRPYAVPPRSAASPLANFTIGFELTTPIGYITSATSLRDPFKISRKDIPASNDGREFYCFASWMHRRKVGKSDTLFATQIARDGFWVLISAGPDQYTNDLPNTFADFSNVAAIPMRRNYDPTNGTVSFGDIYRTQKFTDRIEEAP